MENPLGPKNCYLTRNYSAQKFGMLKFIFYSPMRYLLKVTGFTTFAKQIFFVGETCKNERGQYVSFQ